MATPAVSVVIPVYNGERYLGEAVESVLAQTYDDFEIIVVDDGSTDGTVSVAEGFGDRVTIVSQERGGAGAARNRGCALARGRFLAFLDADDLWLPNKLEVQRLAFERDAGLDVVFGLLEQFRSPGLPPDPALDTSMMDKPFAGYLPSAVMIRTEAFARVGDFVEDMRVGEFIDWYMRAEEQGLRMHLVRVVVTRRRIHSSNVGIRERDAKIDYLKILKSALDRRRSEGQS